jgi:hypothetical protein
MSWLKGSLNRAVASSPTLSSAVAKASTAAGSAYGFVAPTLSKAVTSVSAALTRSQELTAAVRPLCCTAAPRTRDALTLRCRPGEAA